MRIVLKNDREIVMEAVKSDGVALKYASKSSPQNSSC